MPVGAPATVLTFKALQTYSSGEVVRWIGSPSSETPAPQVALADKDAPAHDVLGGARAAASAARRSFTSAGDSTTATVALILGGLGVLGGLIALTVVLMPKRTR